MIEYVYQQLVDRNDKFFARVNHAQILEMTYAS